MRIHHFLSWRRRSPFPSGVSTFLLSSSSPKVSFRFTLFVLSAFPFLNRMFRAVPAAWEKVDASRSSLISIAIPPTATMTTTTTNTWADLHHRNTSTVRGRMRDEMTTSLFHGSGVRYFSASISFRAHSSSGAAASKSTPRARLSPHPLSPHEKRMTKEAKLRRRFREQHHERQHQRAQREQADTWRAKLSLQAEQRQASSKAYRLMVGGGSSSSNSNSSVHRLGEEKREEEGSGKKKRKGMGKKDRITGCVSYAQTRREELARARALLQENEVRRRWLKKMRKR